MSDDDRRASGGKEYRMDAYSSDSEADEGHKTQRTKQRYDEQEEKERRSFYQSKEDSRMYSFEKKSHEETHISGHDFVTEPESRKSEKMKMNESAEDEMSNRQQYVTRPRRATPRQGDECEGELSDSNGIKAYRDEQGQNLDHNQEKRKMLPSNRENFRGFIPMQVDSSESGSGNQMKRGFQSTCKNNPTREEERSFHSDRGTDDESRTMKKHIHGNNTRRMKTSTENEGNSSESAEEMIDQDATERRDAILSKANDRVHEKGRDAAQHVDCDDRKGGNYKAEMKDKTFGRKDQRGRKGTDSESEFQNTKYKLTSNQNDIDSEDEYSNDGKSVPRNRRNELLPKQKNIDSDSEDEYRKNSKRDKIVHKLSSQNLRKTSPEDYDESDSDMEKGHYGVHLEKKGSRSFNQNSFSDNHREHYASEDTRPQRRQVQKNKGNGESRSQLKDYDEGMDCNRRQRRLPAEDFKDNEDTENARKYHGANSENEERDFMSKDAKPQRQAQTDEGFGNDYRNHRSQKLSNDEDWKPPVRSAHRDEHFENDYRTDRSQKIGSDEDWKPQGTSEERGEDFENHRSQRQRSEEDQKLRRRREHRDEDSDYRTNRSQKTGNDEDWKPRRPEGRGEEFENHRSQRQGNEGQKLRRRREHRDEDSDYRTDRSQKTGNDEDWKPRRPEGRGEEFENHRLQRQGNEKDQKLWKRPEHRDEESENDSSNQRSYRRGNGQVTKPQRRPSPRDEHFRNDYRSQESKMQRNDERDNENRKHRPRRIEDSSDDDELYPRQNSLKTEHERRNYINKDIRPHRRPGKSDEDHQKGYRSQRSTGQRSHDSEDEMSEQRQHQFHNSKDGYYAEPRKSIARPFSDENERDYTHEDTKPRRRPPTFSEVSESSYKHRESERDNMKFKPSYNEETPRKLKEKKDILQRENEAECYRRNHHRERYDEKIYDDYHETSSLGKGRSRGNGQHYHHAEYDQSQGKRRGYEENEAYDMERMSINDEAQEKRHRKQTKNFSPDVDKQEYYNRKGKDIYKYGSGANYSCSDETSEDHGYQSWRSGNGKKSERSQSGCYNEKIPYGERQERQYPKFSSSALIAILMKRDGYEVSIETLMKKCGLEQKAVWRVVHKHSELFQCVENRIICLRPQVRVCSAHLNQGCRDRTLCLDLHVCSRYIRNSCQHSKDCTYGHSLSTKHNQSVLYSYQLENVPELQLLDLLAYSIPPPAAQKSARQLKICYDYNNSICSRTVCNYLHVCEKFFATMQCSKSCTLNHDLLLKSNIQILKSHGIETNESPRDIIRSLRESFPHLLRVQKPVGGSGINQPDLKVKARSDNANSETTAARPAAPESVKDKRGFNSFSSVGKEKYLSKEVKNTVAIRSGESIWDHDYLGNVQNAEICYYSVTSRCNFESEGCKRLHAKDHFHWQVKERGKGWVNLRKDQVNVLETAYCDPSKDGTIVPPVSRKNCPSGIINLFGQDSWQVDFSAMLMGNPKTGVKLDLRRLCSENVDGSITHQWYFLDQNKTWVEYGNVDTTKRDFLKSNITSQDIEKQYLQNPSSSMIFKNDMFTYVLDFQQMKQMNTSTNVVRKVRRRPKLQSKKGGFLGFFGM